MKLIILHGDNFPKSYERLTKFIDVAKERGWGIDRVNDKEKEFKEFVSRTDLFFKERLLIVEDINLLSESDINYLNKKGDVISATLIIYSKNTINKTRQKKFKNVSKIEEFKLPKLIWNFLDSLWPGNAKNSLLLLTEVVKTEPIELVFALTARQFRDLFWVRVDPATTQFPPWRAGKLKRQAQKYDEKLLKNIISELAKADIEAKTSSANTKDSLDFLIASKLE